MNAYILYERALLQTLTAASANPISVQDLALLRELLIKEGANLDKYFEAAPVAETSTEKDETGE